jgi:large subunit ribosomal protein L10
MVKQNKIYQVDEVKSQLLDCKSAALVDYQGLSADQINALRAEIKEAGGTIQVIKNTLLQRAFENTGLKLPKQLTGPTAFVSCTQDEIAPLKAIEKSYKTNQRPEFKYAVYKNKLISLENLSTLLSLPGRNQLLANLLAGLQSPASRLAYSLKFHQTKLTLVLKAAVEKLN